MGSAFSLEASCSHENLCSSGPGSVFHVDENVTERLADRLGCLLDDMHAAEELMESERATHDVFLTLVALCEQAIRMGIDYRTLGLGWNHPNARTAYRDAEVDSVLCHQSRKRAHESRECLRELVTAMAHGEVDPEDAVVQAFIEEIGVSGRRGCEITASFEGVAAALEAELLLPLRALNEGVGHMLKTCKQQRPLPRDLVESTVRAVTMSVLSSPSGFSEWRYHNPVGREQLRGLWEWQVQVWQQPTYLHHGPDLRTHEDAPGELGLFWATKIGGPSHGFDYEGQCMLPLLANARHKAILVSDEQWPWHPAGRAHFRLLWVPDLSGMELPSPRLWLEGVHADFAATLAEVCQERWGPAVLTHAVHKADTMGVTLSVAAELAEELRQVVEGRARGGLITPEVFECMLLRPSNGVIEASDYLSSKHDWLQIVDETTEALRRATYTPKSILPLSRDSENEAGRDSSALPVERRTASSWEYPAFSHPDSISPAKAAEEWPSPQHSFCGESPKRGSLFCDSERDAARCTAPSVWGPNGISPTRSINYFSAASALRPHSSERHHL